MRVSPSTVSYALHPVLWKTKRIRPATRQEALRCARALGYRPHRSAVSLRTGKTRTIRVIVPSVAGDLVAQMLQGLEFALGAEFDLMLGVTGWDPERERRLLDSLGERVADGAILVSAGDRACLPSLRALRRWGIPFVQVDHCFDEVPGDIVEPDQRGLASALTLHLLDLGHREIWFLRSPRVHPGTLARCEGYQDAVSAAGLVPRSLPLLPVSQGGPRYQRYLEVMTEALRGARGPIGVVANDLAGMLATLEAGEKAGLGCPADLSICGISSDSAGEKGDGVPFSRFLRREFTRVEWSVEEMGRRAGELLLRRLRGGPGAKAPHVRVALPGRLVLGETTAPARFSPAATRGS